MGQNENENNCIGFARFKLGLDPVENYVEPPTIRILKTGFEMTDAIRADTIAIIGHFYDEIRVVHMAVRLSEGSEKYIHRPGYGAKVRQVYDEGIRADGRYSESWPWGSRAERKIYLKLKEKRNN